MFCFVQYNSIHRTVRQVYKNSNARVCCNRTLFVFVYRHLKGIRHTNRSNTGSNRTLASNLLDTPLSSIP